MRRQRLALRTAPILAFGLVFACGAERAVAQPAEPSQVVAPEDMLEDALKKIEAGDLNEAGRLYQRVRALKPDLPKLKLVNGLLLKELRRGPEALSELEAFNKNAGSEYRGYLAVARLYTESRMWRSALWPYEQAKRIAPIEEEGKPIKARVAIELAGVLQKMKRNDDALKEATDASRLAPNDAEIQYRLGAIQLDTGDRTSAAGALERAVDRARSQLRLDPFQRDMWDLLKQCYELQQGIALAQRAADPDDARAYLMLGRALVDLADVNRQLSLLGAREALLEALNKAPRDSEARVLLARVEAELGGIQDALERLSEVLRDDPENAEARKLREEIQATLRSS